MKNISHTMLRKMSKKDLLKYLSGAGKHDLSPGTITLAHLPQRFFSLLVRQHNAKIGYFLVHISEDDHDLRTKIKSLRITTYSEFQGILDDGGKKKTVAPQLRRARDFFAYRRWVLSVPPLSTWFKNFVRKPFEYFLPFDFRRKHTYLVGASGSGKSETVKAIILGDKVPRENEEATVSSRLTVFLMEPHGDLSEEIAKQQIFYEDFKSSLKIGCDPNLIYIDPLLGYEEGKYPVFNPFDVWDRNYSDFQLGKLAQQLSAAIVAMLGSENELSLQMETLLIPCLCVLLKRKGSTFHDFLRLMNDDPELVDIGKMSSNKAHRNFFRDRFLSPSFKRTKTSLSTKIQANLNHEAFEKMMCQSSSSLDLEKAIQGGKTIIFSLSKGKLGDVGSSIGKLICARLLALALNRAETSEYRVPILLVMDEMQNYVNKSLEVILTETRKYALFVMGAQQIVGQGMDASLTKAILGNTAVKGIGRAGQHSIQHMAREMGVSPEFFQSLGVGQFICQAEDHPPIRIQFTDTYVGDKTMMSTQHWEEVKRWMIDRYYVSESRSPISEITDQQLAEDIGAAEVPFLPPEQSSPLEVDHFDLGGDS